MVWKMDDYVKDAVTTGYMQCDVALVHLASAAALGTWQAFLPMLQRIFHWQARVQLS